jgi:RimJ/RimL family protein N-acetyltransferase
MEAITFRPLAHVDLPLLHEWLEREHILRWWRDSPATLDGVAAKYGPRILDVERVRVFMVEVDRELAGMIQTYLVSDHPEWIGDEPGVAGVDLFIADEEKTGRGLGPRILIEFIRTVVDPAVTACVASPEVANDRSIRAFEKAGFVRERVIPGEWGPELLMRARRA